MKLYVEECQNLADTLHGFCMEQQELDPIRKPITAQETPLNFGVKSAKTCKQLNPKQRELFETSLGLLTGDSDVGTKLDPPIVLVTGPPGTGKSKVIKRFHYRRPK